METSYLKLNAKKRMVKNYLICFTVSIFPFVTIFSLVILNYYLFILLRQTNFSFNAYISPYAEFIRLFLITVCLVLSFCLWRSVCLLKENFFFKKTQKGESTFLKSIKSVRFHQNITYYMVSLIRFFLTISWSTVYLSPCIAVVFLLIYSYRNENYGYNVNMTLFVSTVALLIVGLSFLFVTVKRYSLCVYVILKEKEKNPLKVIARSIALMEGKSIQYALYCFSFIGWIFSCLLVIPAIYVISYINMGKWCFLSKVNAQTDAPKPIEKPVIFYIIPKTKKVGN